MVNGLRDIIALLLVLISRASRIYPVEDINGNRRVVEIIPSTLGWETGLTDKNGTKIFEGDIIEFYFFDKTRRNGEFVEVKNTTTMLIEWYKSSFYMRELFRDYRLNEELEIITEKIYTYRGNKAQGVYESNSSYFVEVIGNIHDNPELLKGG